MEQKRLLLTGAVSALGAAAMVTGTAQAIEFQTQELDFQIIGQGRLQPTYFENFDLNDDQDDPSTGTSAGAVQVGDEHVRAEIRLGAIATGENWSGKLILENDFALDANSVDRANRGARFGIERAYYTYTFNPALTLQAGWEFKNLDMGTGGLLYGDDHPLFGFMGDTAWGGYDVYWMPIVDGLASDVGGLAPSAKQAKGGLDWDVYAGKLDFDLAGGGRLSPMVAYSNNKQFDNTNTWFGVEYVGTVGPVNVRAEGLGAIGEFNGGSSTLENGTVVDHSNDDISAWAGYLSLELPVNNAFNPYVAFRITSGDDDPTDNDVEGWLGITDIARFSPLIGLDGQFMGWGPSNPAIGSLLFGLAPDGAGPGGAGYGGISNTGTGNNPGQIMFAVGSSGNLASISPKLSYHAQVFPLWFQETGGLETLSTASGDVDSFAGTEVDLELKYQANEQFAPRFVFSTFMPGDGVEDATGADDPAYVAMLELMWQY